MASHGTNVAWPDEQLLDNNAWCLSNSFKAYSYGASWAASFRALGDGCLGSGSADIYRIHHNTALITAGESCAHRCATTMMCVGYDERASNGGKGKAPNRL